MLPPSCPCTCRHSRLHPVLLTRLQFAGSKHPPQLLEALFEVKMGETCRSSQALHLGEKKTQNPMALCIIFELFLGLEIPG